MTKCEGALPERVERNSELPHPGLPERSRGVFAFCEFGQFQKGLDSARPERSSVPYFDQLRSGASVGAFFIVLALLTAGCGEAPVLRVVPLTLHDRLPRLDTLLVGDRLRLVRHELEPLREGALIAWARTSSGLAALGPLSDDVATFTVGAPLELEELLVTWELSPAASSPSTSLIFRGRPGEALALGGFGGPSRETMPLAQVTAELENRKLALHATALPFVGTGLHYAVWVRHEGAEPMLLGKLGSSGKDEFEAVELLADFDEVVLTLELDAGDEAAGTELMTGHTLPESATVQTKAPVHDH